MTTPQDSGPTVPPPSAPPAPPPSAAQDATGALLTLVVGSAMFTFISYWRTAAVVLCDLASTVYYIEGIVEQSIGPSAPWFILAVMLFSYAVRSVYIESCALFVRGGVYRVVKEAMGGTLAKLSVSALMFDYILTGPTSGVSAGQYIVGLVLDFIQLASPGIYAHLGLTDPAWRDATKRYGSVIIAIAVTLYFFRQNVIGIRESSGKALKIMAATTVMAVLIVAWSVITLVVRGPANRVPLVPDFSLHVEYRVVTAPDRITGKPRSQWARESTPPYRLIPETDASGRPVPHLNETTGRQEDPLGFIPRVFPTLAERLRHSESWTHLLGLLGLLLAFGHSILAMSGEETLAQVYRDVEAPKLTNFKKAAFIVFLYSLFLTAGVCFLSVLIIPDEVRMKDYSDNLIGGLAMSMVGPALARLALNAFVTIIGFLILAGAVNTAIIGSNGVLNRVAEDGVIPDWFLRPHPRFGTTYRLLTLVVGLQILTIFASRGYMYVLGEAYAFGVVWSFVMKAAAMVRLRFIDRTPREFRVPLNFSVLGVEIPLGLILIFLVLLSTAILNLLTKEVATIGGLLFTGLFMTIFTVSERLHRKALGTAAHEHLEQFNPSVSNEVTHVALHLTRPFRKLVAIRSPFNLFMLEKTLAETDPDTTEVVVLTAKIVPRGSSARFAKPALDTYDQELMTAVVNRAELAGKPVTPLIVPTNDARFAVARAALDLGAQELVVGVSNIYSVERQLEQIASDWRSIQRPGTPARALTIRILGQDRDIRYDIEGGNRIPTFGERRARSAAELRASGTGVRRVLLVHDGSLYCSDLFESILTMLDPGVALAVVRAPAGRRTGAKGEEAFRRDSDLARNLERQVEIVPADGDLVELARARKVDLVIVPLPNKRDEPNEPWVQRLLSEAHCGVLLASPPALPRSIQDDKPKA